MGIVTVAAVPIVLAVIHRLAAMPAVLQIGDNRIVAAGALIRAEEAVGDLIDVGRIRVQYFLDDIRMAFGAHDLPVRGDMPPGLVHQPICVSVNAHAN